MKILFPAILLCSFIRLFAQNEPDSLIYFPKERVVHPDCLTVQNQDSCFSALLERKALAILNTREKRYKSKKDTLELTLSFFTNDSGRVLLKKYHQAVSLHSFKKKTRNELQAIITDLPLLPVVNPKPEPYDVWHNFSLKFLIQKKAIERFKPLHQFDYGGGDILEIPIFPGCEGLSGEPASECFQQKMMEHIEKNFVYPQEALNKGISGEVKTKMTINKLGQITNIKTNGPHYLLTQEAIRILNLVPQLQPGKINGKVRNFPYSIPITFRL